MADWKGVHYSENDMLHMQQEAIRRVRQMQRRSRTLANQGAGLPGEQAPAPAAVPASLPEAPPAVPRTEQSGGQSRQPHPNAAQPDSRQMRPPGGGSRPMPQNPQNPGGQGSLLSQIGQNFGLGNFSLESIGEKLSGLGEKLGFGGNSESEGEGGLDGLLGNIIGESSPIGKVLAALNIDGERLLILGLLLVLMNEKADRTLLIALFYLLF